MIWFDVFMFCSAVAWGLLIFLAIESWNEDMTRRDKVTARLREIGSSAASDVERV